MASLKITVLVAFLIFVHQSNALRRRRRQRCPVRDCQVSSWSDWSSCSALQCGQQGSQSRSRQRESSASCGGAECPDLHETQHCFAIHRDIAESVLGLPGVFAEQKSADNKDHKEDQDRKNFLCLVI